MRSARAWTTLAALVLVAVILWLLARERAPDSAETAAVIQARNLAANSPSPGDSLALRVPQSATISGIVHDRAGIPIDDAQVCAWASDDMRDEEPQCSKSNGDGRYRLSSLEPGHLTLHASASGFLPRRWAGRVRLSPGEVREHFDFVLQVGGAPLRGVVRDISGGVVEGAWVVGRPYEFGVGNRSVARSDAEGRFTLWTRAGRVDLDVNAEGYARTSQLAVAPGPTFDLFMTPESVIVGRVIRIGSGVPVEGVTIIASAQRSSVEPASTRSDASGRFRIDQLEPGIYELEARADDLHGEATELVHLGLAETVADVEIELHPAFSVRGRVIVAGSQGDCPCTEGRVQLIDRGDDHSSVTTSLRDGEVNLGGVLPGTYEVAVHCEEAIAEGKYPDVVVRDANLVDLVWTVHEGQGIHGVVVDDDGSPVEGVRVRAWMRAPADDPTAPTTDGRSAPSLDDGSFSVIGLLPGTYEIAAEHGDTTSAVEVVLDPGTDARSVEVVLPPEGAIAGIVRDQQGESLSDIGVQVASVGSMSTLVAISDDQGRFRLEHVPPGPQRVVVFDDSGPGVLVQVEPGDTARVELVVPARDGSVRGRVLDSDGSPVPDAFIRHQLMTATGFSSTDAAVLTDADGGFEIDGLLAATPYRIGAFRRGGGEAVVEGAEAGDVVTLILVDMAELAGQVLAPSGSPPDRFRVTVHDPSSKFTRSDELFRTCGRFRIHELPPADYVVLVESPDGVARVEGIQLEPGEFEQDLVIRLVPRVTVRGRIVDQRTHKPVPGIIVTIGLQGTGMRFGPPSASERARTSGVDGRFEVPHAPTGKVRISIEPRSPDAGYEWQWVDAEVPATGDVVELGDLELAPAQGR
jgi:protocatechuate 3,4-dioxygenase beta subunit